MWSVGADAVFDVSALQPESDQRGVAMTLKCRICGRTEYTLNALRSHVAIHSAASVPGTMAREHYDDRTAAYAAYVFLLSQQTDYSNQSNNRPSEDYPGGGGSFGGAGASDGWDSGSSSSDSSSSSFSDSGSSFSPDP